MSIKLNLNISYRKISTIIDHLLFKNDFLRKHHYFDTEISIKHNEMGLRIRV